jgi:hypothetical protein
VIFAKDRAARFLEISHIILDYYELIQQRSLLHSEQVKSLGEWQAGRTSQTEFRKLALDIHKDIGLMRSLYNQIKIYNEEGKTGKFIDLLHFHFISLDYLQTKIKPYLFENYNEGLNQLSHFKEEKTEFSEGKFFGLLAITLKNLHGEDGDINHLHKALVYAGKSYDYYYKRNDKSALSGISYQLAGIAEKLAAQDPSNLGLKTQARNYYQDVLNYYHQSSYEMMPGQLEEIQDRIEELEDKNPSAIQLTF